NLLFGRIADRVGRKLPLQVGLLWDAVSLFLYSLATTPLLLALVRVSHGIGSGLVGPSSMALVADTSTKERKGRAMALHGMSLALAVVIGFGIAGPVVARLGYPALFYVLSAGLLVGFVIAIPISEPAQAAPRGMPWRRLFSYAGRPSPAAGYAAIFSLYFILGAFVALVPLHLQQELGYGALAVGLSFTAFAILSLLLHYPAGILADRYGNRDRIANAVKLRDRKSTRLNSSHVATSYAVFCLKKNKTTPPTPRPCLHCSPPPLDLHSFPTRRSSDLVPLHLQQELGYGALAVGLSFTAFAILSLLLHYPAGILADRYGNRDRIANAVKL